MSDVSLVLPPAVPVPLPAPAAARPGARALWPALQVRAALRPAPEAFIRRPARGRTAPPRPSVAASGDFVTEVLRRVADRLAAERRDAGHRTSTGGQHMTRDGLIGIAERIEADPLYDAALCRAAFDLADTHLPEIDSAMVRNGAIGSVDAVLEIVDHAFPGWSIAIHGTARSGNGDWTVTLRESDTRDSDAYLGVGRGPKLSNALIAAFLKALARRPAAQA